VIERSRAVKDERCQRELTQGIPRVSRVETTTLGSLDDKGLSGGTCLRFREIMGEHVCYGL